MDVERLARYERKPWGWNEELWRQWKEHHQGYGIMARACRIHIERGGYSSIHRHLQQCNTFYVVAGVLRLKEFTLDGRVPVESGERVMMPDDHPVTFKAGVVHQFVAQSDVDALEIYIATESGSASPEDIDRFSENGRLVIHDQAP